jgi:hypothetical protein
MVGDLRTRVAGVVGLVDAVHGGRGDATRMPCGVGGRGRRAVGNAGRARVVGPGTGGRLESRAR